MADHNDGSIIIDTELDNDGFEKGSNKLLGAVKELTGAIDTLGDNVMDSFGKITPYLATIADSVSQITGVMKSGATQITDANAGIVESEQQIAATAQQTAGVISDSSNTAKTSVSGLEKQINSINSDLQSVSRSAETGFSSGSAVLSFDNKLSIIESKLVSAREKLAAFGETKMLSEDYVWVSEQIAKAEAALEKLIKKQETMSASGIGATVEKYEDLKNQLAAVSEEADKAWAEMMKLQEEGVTAADPRYDSASRAYDQADRARWDLSSQISKYEEDTSVMKQINAWEKLTDEIQQTKYMLEDYQADLSSMETSGEAFVKGSDTEEFARMTQAVNETAEALDRNRALIDSEAINQARLNVEAAQEAVVRANTASERQAAIENLATAQQNLNNIASSMSNKNLGPSENSISGWQRFGSSLRSAGTAAMTVASRLAKVSFSAISSGLKSVTSKLKSFISTSKSAATNSNILVKALTSLKTMLKSRIKRMFVSSIISSVKTGIQSLAQYSSTFNTSMSNIKNSAKELSSNISVSLGYLIETIEPFLTRVIDSLSTAVSYLNAMIASLKGESTVTVAKKQMDSYADSVSDTSDAVSELTNQVYGFDKLNKRSDSSSSSSSDSSDLFETVSVNSLLPDGLSSFIDRIKSKIASGDWEGVGVLIGTQLNSVLQKINDYIRWDKVGAKITKKVKSMAALFNGFVSAVDWDLIGDTLAQGFNTVVNTAYLFLTEFDWKKFATGLGTVVKSFIQNVDWQKLGLTLSTGFATIFSSITGFINALDGKSITNAISNFIKGVLNVDWVATLGDFSKSISDFIMEMDFGDVAQSLSDMFATALKGLNSAVVNFDWAGLGAQIADFINNIDWVDLIGNLGELLGNLVKGVFEWATTLTDKTDFRQMAKDIVKGIKTALENIDWLDIAVLILKSIVQSLFAVPTEIAIGLAEGIYDAIKDGFEQASDAFDTIQQYVQPYIDEAGGNVAEGYYNAIVDRLDASWPYLKEHVAVPLAETFGFTESDVDNWASGIKTFFSETVPGIWDSFKTWISETVPNWFKSIPEKVGGWFSDIGTKVKDWFTNLPDNISTWFDNLWQPIRDFDWSNLGYNIGQWFGNAVKDAITFVTETVPEWFSGVWDSITTALSTFFTETLPNFFSSVWDGIKTFFTETLPTFFTEWIPQAWEDIKTFFSELPEKIWNAIQSGWDWLVDVGTSIIDGIWEGLQTVWTAITDFVSNFVQGFKDALGIHSPSTVFADIGENIVNGLLGGIKAVWDTVTGFFSDAWSGITSFFSDTWENIKTGASTAWGNITGALSGAWEGIKTKASTAWENIKSTISTGWENIKTGASTAWENIKTTVSGKWENIKSTASTAWGNLKNTIGTGWENIKTGATTAWENIKTTVSNKWDSLKSTASTKFDNIKTTIQNKGWWGIGSDICSGISNGINAGWNWLSTTVSDLASNMINTAKNVLGIHSPSKLFHDVVGLNIGYGIGEGVKDATPDILNDVTGVTSAIAKEMNAEVPPLEIAENGVVYGLNLVASRLSGIAETFRTITDMLLSIGGFSMPQIAAGSIVPAKTRIASSADETNAYGLPAAFIEGVDEQLDDITTLLRQLIAIVKALNLNIDIDALTNAITRRQRSNARNYGGNV